MKTKLITIILIAIFLTGCGTQPVKVSMVEVAKPTLVLPSVEQYHNRPVKWITITEDNYQEVFRQLKKKGKHAVLFGVTDDGYEALAANMQDILKIIRQYKAILAAYEEYYNE